MTQTMPFDDVHLCNRCINRDFSALQAVEISPRARHVCGADPIRCMTLTADGAVMACTQYESKRGCAHAVTGPLDCEQAVCQCWEDAA